MPGHLYNSDSLHARAVQYIVTSSWLYRKVACRPKIISCGHPGPEALWYIRDDINQKDRAGASGHLGFSICGHFLQETIREPVVSWRHFGHYWIKWVVRLWVVHCLLITDGWSAVLCGVVLLLCSFLLLSKYWQCVSVFSLERSKTRWNTGNQVEDSWASESTEGGGAVQKTKTVTHFGFNPLRSVKIYFYRNALASTESTYQERPFLPT